LVSHRIQVFLFHAMIHDVQMELANEVF